VAIELALEGSWAVMRNRSAIHGISRSVTATVSSPLETERTIEPPESASGEIPRMTIFQVHQKTSFSTGSVQQMLQAAVGLSSRGHRVVLVNPDEPKMRAVCAAHGIDYRPLPFRHELDVATWRGLRRLLAGYQPDVIHVHKGRAHWLTLAALAGHPSPALIANRGVSFPLSILNRGKYRSSRTDRIITVCEKVRDVVMESGRIEREKIDVVYAGADLQRFDPDAVSGDALRREEGIPADAFVILHAGMRRWKGWREIIEVLAASRSRGRDARLVFVGSDSGPFEGQIRNYLDRTGLAGAVHMLGYRPDIERVIAAADVVVDASWEGTGITGTIREAMALGKAVIATDCGGNRELVRSSELGWLVEPRDHEQLLAAVLEVMENPDRRAAVGRNARTHVRENFSLDARIDRLERVYAAAASSRRLRHAREETSEREENVTSSSG
jgi:L-malate glycosyltransferase